jgi:Xaa-Pro aminopeptidase
MDMDYRGRQWRLAEALDSARLDALLVTHIPNIRYLCGFTGSAGILVATASRFTFFSDGRYREQARAQVQRARVVVPKGPVLDAAARTLADSKLKIVGVEGEHVSMATGAKLARMLRPQVRIRAMHGLIEQQRMIKDATEVENIRAAVRFASSLFDGVVGAIRPGVAEQTVAAQLEYAARNGGADGMSFDTIVAAGERSALPHGRASTHSIPRTGFVVLDFGVILAGYCSDMTRTVHVGHVSERSRSIYQAVREAQQAAIDAVRPCRRVGEVDKAARCVLQRHGFARCFTHSTGHGVGLEIHEPPRVARGEQQLLKPGMVITIEPGVYVPGYGGVRIEDMVIVTQTACEVLTPTTKELLTV